MNQHSMKISVGAALRGCPAHTIWRQTSGRKSIWRQTMKIEMFILRVGWIMQNVLPNVPTM